MVSEGFRTTLKISIITCEKLSFHEFIRVKDHHEPSLATSDVYISSTQISRLPTDNFIFHNLFLTRKFS